MGSALHIRFQLPWLQYSVAACRILKHLVQLAHQHRLLVNILVVVHHKVGFHLTLRVRFCLNGDNAHADQFQDTCRHQVIIIAVKIFIGIQYLVSLLQIAVQGHITIPHQPLVQLALGPPYTVHLPHGATNYHQGCTAVKQDEQHPLKGTHIILVVLIVHVVATLKGLFLLVLKGIVLPYGRLKHALGEFHHQVQSSLAAHGFGGLGHHKAVLHPYLALKLKAPHAARVLIDYHRTVGSGNGHTGMLRFWRYSGIQEHMADGTRIGIAAHQSSHHIGGGVRTLALGTQAPAQLKAALGGNNTAFVLFPTARLVHVPIRIYISGARFVGHCQVLYNAWPHVSQADIALCTLAVDGHLSCFSNQGIAIFVKHHPYVQVVQLRTGQYLYYPKQQKYDCQFRFHYKVQI